VGIACEADGQSLVVADAFAQRLIKIDLTTGNQSYLTARPETLDPLSSEPKLDFPTHVAIEADGNYIVTDGRDDLRDRRVIRIDKGTGIASLIVADTGNGFFDQPRGVRIAK
jgi:DNA-binding beta-propeller fold protein YncE